MVQLIDKAAVVAEIERIKKEECPTDSYEGRCKLLWFEQFLSFINTLETKDVNLEEECKTYLKNNFTSKEAPDEFLTTQMQLDDMVLFAKHFYELGLNAQSDKELVEEIYSHIDGIRDTADRMTSGNFMHHRAAIKFSANVIEQVLGLIGLKAQK